MTIADNYHTFVTLSRRPDYTLGKDASERTMTFLKPEQVDTSLLNPADPILATYLLNVATEIPRTQRILTALNKDPEISPYLPQIWNPAWPEAMRIPLTSSLSLPMRKGWSYTMDACIFQRLIR
jgi:hypothetical protein